MKNIISGMVAGGVAGLAIDGSMNKKGEHDYLSSLVLGAAVGGIGVGVWGAKAAPGLINTSSHHVAPAPTPHVAPAPTQKGPGILSTAQTRISSAGALVWEKSLGAGKNVWGKLNSDIPTPNIKWPHLPSINVNLGPARQFANKAASASINAISSAGHKLSSSASQVSEKIANKAKKLIATARQNHIPPIRLKAPSINLRMPSMPTNLLSGVQNQIENGIKASSGYIKKGLFATAVAASSIASHGPSFNPVKPTIEHAQQTMSTSAFGASAYNMVSQAFDDVIHAIPRMMEHPRQTIQKAYNSSAVKPAIEASAAGNSFGMSNYSDELARRMVINKTNNGQPFIVADPKYGTLSTYDARGIKTGTHNALFGKNQLSGNDAINPFENPEVNASLANAMSRNVDAGFDWLDRNNLRRIHPGIYQYRKVLLDYSSKYGKFGLQDTNIVGKSNNSPGLGFAIHNTYLGTPLERRAMRLKSKTVDDNFISYGCVNVDPEQLQKVILPKLGERVQVAMASVDQSMRGKYLGLSDSPMFDNNKAALELVQNLKPSSNFIIADKKDRLAGLYSPSGKLMDYFPVEIGKDSARSEIFQGGKMGSWTPDRAAFMDQIVRDKRRITPSGVFEMKKQKYKDTGVEYIGDTSYDRNSRQQFAMHSSFGTSSFGCLIPSKDDMSRVLPRLGDTTFVGVLPNSGQLNTSVVQRIDPRGKHKKAFSWF